MTNKDKVFEIAEKTFYKHFDAIKNIPDEEMAVYFQNVLKIKIDIGDIANLIWFFYKKKYGEPDDLNKFWFEEFVDVGEDYLKYL